MKVLIVIFRKIYVKITRIEIRICFLFYCWNKVKNVKLVCTQVITYLRNSFLKYCSRSSDSSSYWTSSSNSCISSNKPHSLLSSINISWPGSISSFDSCASYSTPFYDDFSCFFHSTPYGSFSTASHTSCSSDSYSSLPSSTNPSSNSSPYNSIEDSLSNEGDSLSASDCVVSDEIDDLSGMVSTQVGGLRPFSEIVGKVDVRPCMLRPFSDILNGQG